MNLQWMRDDALLLKKNGRLQGCLLLLLCLVDAQAKERCSSHIGNRTLYCSYLKTRLSEIGHDTSYRVEEKNRLIHISEIIYEYFRCFLVHEGNTRDDPSYEIQLKYEPNPKSVFGAGIFM